jgi:hypothetical protein
MAYGTNPGDVRQDEEGIANMKNLGQNMAFLLRKIASVLVCKKSGGLIRVLKFLKIPAISMLLLIWTNRLLRRI